MARRFCVAVLGMVLLVSGAATDRLVHGQGKSVWDGVFSADQAKRGGTLYDDKCSGCHEKDLSGTGMAGELAGPTFRKNYDGMTLDDLYGRVRETMPADGPGTLTPQQYADIVSYMLLKNDYPAGANDLSPDQEAMKSIRLLAAKP